jgi:hypothetical protein
MPSQEIKKSNKFCFSQFLCSKNSNSKDYECLPYEEENNKITSIKPEVQAQIIKNRAKLTHLNKLTKQTTSATLNKFYNQQPEFQSTKIEQTVICHKITNTLIKQNTISSFNNTDLCLSNISEESSLSTDSSEYSSSNIYLSSSSSSSDSDVFESCRSEIPYSDIYVCCQTYQPKCQGDISLEYAERVYVLHATEEFALIKKINKEQ